MEHFLGTRAGRRRATIAASLLALAWLAALFALRPIASTAGPDGTFYTTGPRASDGPVSGDRAPFWGDPGEAGLTTLDGGPLGADQLRGRLVWVVFWASWCPPCVREAAAVQTTYEAHRSDGLAVLAVNLGESPTTVRAFLAAHGLDYPVALDPDQRFATAFGLFGLPTHYFVGRDGRIVDRYFGELTGAVMEQRVTRLLHADGG